MISEINIAGIFVSPLLLCVAIGLLASFLASQAMDSLDLYRFVWRRPLFEAGLSVCFVGFAFIGLWLTTTHGLWP